MLLFLGLKSTQIDGLMVKQTARPLVSVVDWGSAYSVMWARQLALSINLTGSFSTTERCRLLVRPLTERMSVSRRMREEGQQVCWSPETFQRLPQEQNVKTHCQECNQIRQKDWPVVLSYFCPLSFSLSLMKEEKTKDSITSNPPLSFPALLLSYRPD